jgi:putative acetyltransferase
MAAHQRSASDSPNQIRTLCQQFKDSEVLLPSTIDIVRTDSTHPDFMRLVRMLDTDLAERDGAEHSFYAQFNKIDTIKYVVLAYVDGEPLGCGALKQFGPSKMEIKRMFVPPEGRKRGIASRVLTELESWARELSSTTCVLETGKRQPEAIGLYRKNGYRQIPNYGQYAGKDNSVCFEKDIT